MKGGAWKEMALRLCDLEIRIGYLKFQASKGADNDMDCDYDRALAGLEDARATYRGQLEAMILACREAMESLEPAAETGG